LHFTYLYILDQVYKKGGHIMSRSEAFWLNDPNAFVFNSERYGIFIPEKSMTLEEQLNAAFRFSLIFSIMVIIIKHDIQAILFATGVGIMTIFIYKRHEKQQKDKKELFKELNVKKDPYQGARLLPTKENPFMNVKLTDYKYFPNRPPASDVTKEETKKLMKKYYNDTVFKDVDDIFDRNVSERQFYTMPSTTIPNDQKQFAELLYGQMNENPRKQRF